VFRNVIIDNFTGIGLQADVENGIVFDSTISGDKITISDTFLTAFSGIGIDLSCGGNDYKVIRSELDAGGTVGSTGIRVDATARVWLVENYYDGAIQAVDIVDGDYVWIIDSIMDAGGSSTTAIDFSTASTYTHAIIAGNDFEGAWDLGVDTTTADILNGLCVADNRFRTCDEGIDFDPVTSGNAVITGNVFNACGTGGAGQLIRARQPASISNNVIIGGAPDYGIDVGARCSVSGNEFNESQCRRAIVVDTDDLEIPTSISGNNITLLDGTGDRYGIYISGDVTNGATALVTGNSIRTPHVGIFLATSTDGCVITGNWSFVTNDRDSAANAALIVNGDRHAITGNTFYWKGDNASSDDTATVFFNTATSCSFVGNTVYANNDADSNYANGAQGMSAVMLDSSTDIAIIGNYMFNRGSGNRKNTLQLGNTVASAKCTILGNVIENATGANYFIEVNATGGGDVPKFGDATGLSFPGTNMET
jgi:hypothetical protein